MRRLNSYPDSPVQYTWINIFHQLTLIAKLKNFNLFGSNTGMGFHFFIKQCPPPPPPKKKVKKKRGKFIFFFVFLKTKKKKLFI